MITIKSIDYNSSCNGGDFTDFFRVVFEQHGELYETSIGVSTWCLPQEAVEGAFLDALNRRFFAYVVANKDEAFQMYLEAMERKYDAY